MNATATTFDRRPEAGTQVEYLDSMGKWVPGATVTGPEYDSPCGTWINLNLGQQTTWRKLSEIRPAKS